MIPVPAPPREPRRHLRCTLLHVHTFIHYLHLKSPDPNFALVGRDPKLALCGYKSVTGKVFYVVTRARIVSAVGWHRDAMASPVLGAPLALHSKYEHPYGNRIRLLSAPAPRQQRL